MESGDSWKEKIPLIEQKLGYQFCQRDWIKMAFTHASLVNESRIEETSNQRLEFLGDALLGAVVAEHLFLAYPEFDEGQMTRLRAQLVDRSACFRCAKTLGIGNYMRVGRGEHVEAHSALLADLFEAIIGAIFIDGGYLAAKNFIARNCLGKIEGTAWEFRATSSKSKLQALSQRQYQQLPDYTLLSMEGPNHRLVFSVSVSIGGRVLGTGEGRSKKQAEERAAQTALEQFEGKPH